MKLRRLEVENFGIFNRQTFEFDAGLALVFGPNEAGKSTLLQLIRELLFGFKPLQNPYVFDEHVDEMAATATFDVSDGASLRFRRRKGKKNEVVGALEPSGRGIDAGALGALLGGATKELYEQVFGFSLRELTDADESLKRANLTDALYGGGLGGLANIQKVQAELQAEADGLFTPRGRNKQLIHRLLGEIKEHAKALKIHTVKPRDFERLVREGRDAAGEVESQRQELDALRRRKAHVDRLVEASQPWLQRREAEQLLSELSVPAVFPIDAGEQFTRLKTRRTEVADELMAIEQELAEESDQLSALRLAPELIANEAAIRELEQQIMQIVGYRRDIPLRQQDSDSIKARVLAQLQSFSPDWDYHHLERFRTTLEQRDTIERLESELEEIQRQRASTAVARGAVQSDIKQFEKQLARTETHEAPEELATLLDQATIYERNRERYGELRDQLIESDELINALLAKLNSPLKSKLDEATELQLPLEATVSEFREALKRSEQEVTEAERRAEATELELEQKREQLAQLDARATVPDREQLLASRGHRDRGWRLIQKQWLEGDEASRAAAEDWVKQHGDLDRFDLTLALAKVYEQSVAAADALADERQDKAEQAAIRDQLKHEVNGLAKHLASDQEHAQLQRQRHAQSVAQWESLWSGCPFKPLSPDAMLQWLGVFDRLSQAQAKRTQLKRKAAALQATIARFKAELATMFSDDPRKTDQLLARARQLYQVTRDAIVQRQTFERQLAEKQDALRTLDERLGTIDEQLGNWQSRWEALLDQFEFPRQWDVHLAAKILGGMADARNQWDKASDLDRRVDDMTAGIGEFHSAVQALCRQLAPALTEYLPEVAMKELQLQLDTAKATHGNHERLQASLAKLRKRQTVKQQQLSQVDSEIAKLLAVAGTRSDVEFERIAAAARRRAELLQAAREASTKINIIRGSEDEDAFLVELAGADSDSLAAQQSHICRQLEKVEADYNAAFKRATLLDDQRKQIDGASLAADIALDLESTRGQLAAAVDRWAPLVLAQALMKHSIKRFEREHQPAMLADVEHLLRRMTLGRYTSIERKLDERGSLLVIDQSGKPKAPHQLSTGTREQLYLAIRLAYIRHYCRDSEPLPIVMDDVLVNFDAQRARQTLSVFAEVAEEVQIIFLTCHQHMMELLNEVVPTCRPIVLPGGTLPAGEVVASRTRKSKSLPTVP